MPLAPPPRLAQDERVTPLTDGHPPASASCAELAPAARVAPDRATPMSLCVLTAGRAQPASAFPAASLTILWVPSVVPEPFREENTLLPPHSTPPAIFPESHLHRTGISRQYRAPSLSRKSDTLFFKVPARPWETGLLSTAYAKPLALVVGEPMMVGPVGGRLSASGTIPTDVLAGRHGCS